MVKAGSRPRYCQNPNCNQPKALRSSGRCYACEKYGQRNGGKNGVELGADTDIWTGTPQTVPVLNQKVADRLVLAAGDQIGIGCQQNSGGTVSTNNGSPAYTYLSLSQVSI